MRLCPTPAVSCLVLVQCEADRSPNPTRDSLHKGSIVSSHHVVNTDCREDRSGHHFRRQPTNTPPIPTASSPGTAAGSGIVSNSIGSMQGWPARTFTLSCSSAYNLNRRATSSLATALPQADQSSNFSARSLPLQRSSTMELTRTSHHSWNIRKSRFFGQSFWTTCQSIGAFSNIWR